MHRLPYLVEIVLRVDPPVEDHDELLRGHLEVDETLDQGVEDVGEDTGVPLVPPIGLGEHREAPQRDQPQPDLVLVVALLLAVAPLKEVSRLVIGEEVGRVEEEPLGVNPLGEEGLENPSLDPMGDGAGEETFPSLVHLSHPVEPLQVAAKGTGGGMAHGGKDQGKGRTGDPGGHLLAAERFLHAGGELEEEDVLDCVAVKEASRGLPLEGLEESGLGDRVQEARGLSEGEGTQGSGGRALELLEEGVSGAHVDLADIAGPLLSAALLDEAHVTVAAGVLPLEGPRHHSCATDNRV